MQSGAEGHGEANVATNLSTPDQVRSLTLDDARAQFERAQADLEAGRLAAAEEALAGIVASGHFAEWANFFLGRTRQRACDLPGALDAFTAAVAAEPALFWAHYERLVTARMLGADAGRLAGLVGSMAELEWETLAHGHTAEIEAVADVLWAAGMQPLAISLAEHVPYQLLSIRWRERLAQAGSTQAAPAREVDTPAGVPQTDQEAADLLVHARQRFEGGKMREAAAGFEALVASGRLAHWGHFYLGRIYTGEADQGRALRAFDAALHLEPGLFWAHYERLVLVAALEPGGARLDELVRTFLALNWEPIHGNHVRELERVAHVTWDAEARDAAARLLVRLWPSADLQQLGLIRLIESHVDGRVASEAVERLEGFSSLDELALRILSNYHQEHGDVDREVRMLERTFARAPKDFQTWLALVRAHAKAGRREQALATLDQGAFAPRQKLFVSLIASLELGDLDAAFLAFRDHCRIYAEIPKFPGIRIAYLLGDQFDTVRRNEVLGILVANYEDDRDVALVRINAAMRDQRWDEARAIFDRFFGEVEDLPQPVRLARVDILAYSGRLPEAAALLGRERIDGAVPLPFLRSTIRILSELDRWDEVFDTGVRHLADDHSFEHFLSPLIRASRKCGRGEALLEALLALPRPLKRQHNEALYAVMEDLAEQGHADIIDRIGDLPLPYEREHRIQLKLRGIAGSSPVAKDLCIYYCADRNYLLPALVSLTALAMSNVSITRRAVFHLVVDSEVVSMAESWGGAIARRLGLSLEVTDASTIVSSADRLRTSYGIFTGGQSLALAAYYRIFFARWLCDQHRYSQALYIDADTIVRSGLDELIVSDREAPLLARYEIERPEVRHATEVHQLKGRYFNSGVLRFDLTNPELPGLLDKAIAAAIDPEVTLIFQDQCALNIAFDTKMAELPERFNYFNPPSVSGDGISATDAVIVHFLDRPKPWDSLYRRRAREWFEWYDLVQTLRQSEGVA
jgi:lipopolysaccharide biosynthesis glycosyltransferase/predicted Zn-dependent protease